MCRRFESDLRQYFYFDLSDFYVDESVSVRWLVDRFLDLPLDSRVVRHATKADEKFDVNQHLLADIIDVLNQVFFEVQIAAAAGAGKEYPKVSKKRPKPVERPGTEKPKKKFLTGKELKARFSGKTSVTINHTKACIDSKINEGGQKLNCRCPAS